MTSEALKIERFWDADGVKNIIKQYIIYNDNIYFCSKLDIQNIYAVIISNGE